MDDRYWELYDDQTSADFSELSYVDLQGHQIVVPTEEDLAKQVYDIRRRVGASTEIKLYAREVACV